MPLRGQTDKQRCSRCYVYRTDQNSRITDMISDNPDVSLSSLLLLHSRTSTSCATGQHWNTWGALTTMQHNHSHRAASLVKPLRSVPSVPSQPPSTHLTPSNPNPSPAATGGGGRRKGRALRTRRRAQPITEIHADLTNIMRFCFKKNNRNITMTLTNMTTLVQMRQRRPAARLSALSKPNLPDCQRLLVALRERSLCFYVNFIVILWFITSNVIV